MSAFRWVVLPLVVVVLLVGWQNYGPQPTVTNACDHPVEIAVDTLFGLGPDDDLMPLRERRATVVLAPDETYGAPVANFTSGSMTGIIFGQDEAKMWTWGQEVTGSPEFTISGDLCLEPSP